MQIIRKSALLHVENRRLLCVRTKGIVIFYNVGGKPESGETAEQALVREVEEEIGVKIIENTIVHAGTFTAPFVDDPEKCVEIEAFFADFEGNPDPKNEIAELGWFTTKDAEKLPPAGQQILAFLKGADLID